MGSQTYLPFAFEWVWLGSEIKHNQTPYNLFFGSVVFDDDDDEDDVDDFI